MIYLQLTTGRGPSECSIALHWLSKRILAEGPGALLVRSSPYSTIISMDGSGDLAYAKSWTGTILWICEDPITKNRKRKNWYLGCQMVELPTFKPIVVREDDLKWETKKASGKGGQHVNKTESAVRLTHMPTGLVVISEDQRSQHRNKAIAIERLSRALSDQKQVEIALLEKANWTQHNSLERGNPIRTFLGKEFVEK
jgi:peptide chain release factor